MKYRVEYAREEYDYLDVEAPCLKDAIKVFEKFYPWDNYKVLDISRV